MADKINLCDDNNSAFERFILCPMFKKEKIEGNDDQEHLTHSPIGREKAHPLVRSCLMSESAGRALGE